MLAQVGIGPVAGEGVGVVASEVACGGVAEVVAEVAGEEVGEVVACCGGFGGVVEGARADGAG
ncbi:hypothetical protein, partial [Nocardiopsis deserti]|uniref:hypothetical protein n=1 Tax=Nocardiopsis deserti TaxID=2605988 RepID=UPI001CC230BD